MTDQIFFFFYILFHEVQLVLAIHYDLLNLFKIQGVFAKIPAFGSKTSCICT